MNKILFKTKAFNELSLVELYQILQLRSEVFVVEQDCVYQDLDGKDEKALHVMGYHRETVVAYARLFAPGIYFNDAAIGRVVVHQNYRALKLGRKLMETAMDGIVKHYKTNAITVSAQLYLKRFYEDHGFTQEGETYLEDGIPHIRMHAEL
ncbi:GNAT family N-acetyltransferase [Flavobacterium rhizosphaerae]|uniref:GNAT family N-acetyltransferase n=1 Tax=Flavobacterium rhizosphaerae TaxID=3163298 RepID=A0ABW8YZX2_9FLAO